ncbi:MAG: response regulator transcription factor [Lachnospiraceae bacterium]|nr:response regulator transcription factor [Lachnospiraceae bacterium]MCR5831078.1 response regulator transcription factor [Lachnospiraceae bacterium]
MAAHILVVEDEEKLARFVELELVHEGYEVTKSGDGREALDLATANTYDLILLDIMLPGLNGLEVLRRLGNSHPTPVILLTARDAVMDKVSGLDAGAVDYITKPFAIEELLARIRVALKLHPVEGRGSQAADGSDAADAKSGKNDAANGIYRWKELELDEKKHRVTFKGQEISLTNREFEMLKVFLTNQDIVLTRDTLLEKVCGYDYVGETNVIDVYVRFLRSKIDEAFDIKMIETVRGVGYVIKSEQ